MSVVLNRSENGKVKSVGRFSVVLGLAVLIVAVDRRAVRLLNVVLAVVVINERSASVRNEEVSVFVIARRAECGQKFNLGDVIVDLLFNLTVVSGRNRTYFAVCELGVAVV